MIQSTVASLVSLASTLSGNQLASVEALIASLNATLVASSAVSHALNALQQVESSNSSVGLAGCPAAEAGGGMWGALQNCTEILCHEMELFSLVANQITGSDQPVLCQSSDYLLNKARFVTSISFGCGTSQDAPLLNATVNGTEIAINITHRCVRQQSDTML